MRLDEFIALENISKADLASQLGCSTEALRPYIKGERPKRGLVGRIYIATSGLVCPNDLYGLHPPEAGSVNGLSIASRIKRLFGLGARP